MTDNLPKYFYYDKSIETLKEIDKLSQKPCLLLHACCGPCSCFPLVFLCPHFRVTIYYGNSNIYPESEYQKRLATLKELLMDLKRDYGFEIGLITPPYDNHSYMKELAPYAQEPEGGKRCHLCYEKRMEEAYAYAEREHYDYFCTLMTISRQKSSLVMNQIGEKLEKKHPSVPYFYSDFKKKDGALKGQRIRAFYGLYNQDYCGCVYSLENRKRQKEKEALQKQIQEEK